MSVLTSDLILAAYLEFNYIAAGEPLPDEDALFGLQKANLILDEWTTDENYVFNRAVQLFNYTANHQPTLIGPTAVNPDITLAGPRVTEVESAGWMLNGVKVPLDVYDDDAWAAVSIKTQTAVSPIALYFSPTVPNGSIYLWPIPTTSSQLELMMWNMLDQIPDLTTQLDLAPGYQMALTMTLAEMLESSIFKTSTPALVANANRARLKIQSRNVESPRAGTRDSGMPGGRASGWNFRTGSFRRNL